jgi:site-specific recombinase XerD
LNIRFSVNTGLRISDTPNIKHKDLADEKIIIIEKKAQKQRIIALNDLVKKSYNKLLAMLNEAN